MEILMKRRKYGEKRKNVENSYKEMTNSKYQEEAKIQVYSCLF